MPHRNTEFMQKRRKQFFENLKRLRNKSEKIPEAEIKITRGSNYSGYFGNPIFRDKPEKAAEIVFHLDSLPAHRGSIKQKYQWSKPDSIVHSAISIVEGKAVLTVIQETARLKEAGLTDKERKKYRNGHIATLLAAYDYCKEKNLPFYAVHPSNYQALHSVGGLMSPEMAENYKKTLEALMDGLNLKVTEVSTENEIGEYYPRFFGLKLLKFEEK